MLHFIKYFIDLYYSFNKSIYNSHNFFSRKFLMPCPHFIIFKILAAKKVYIGRFPSGTISRNSARYLDVLGSITGLDTFLSVCYAPSKQLKFEILLHAWCEKFYIEKFAKII